MDTNLNFIRYAHVMKYCSSDFFLTIKIVKTILNSWAIQKQTVGLAHR